MPTLLLVLALIALAPGGAAAVVPFDHVVVDANGPANSDSKTVADLNGDGFPDLVVAGTGGPIHWYASPSWTRNVITTSGGGWSTDIEAGDINRDGRLDLVVSDWYQNDRIVWFENPAPGRPWVLHPIGNPRAHDIELGDLDRDGDLDVVTRQVWASGSTLELWRQDSPSSWVRRSIPCPSGEGLHLADLDRDGDLDVVIGARWYENGGSIASGSWPGRVYAVDWSWAATYPYVGDLNGDGRPDIVLTPSESAGASYRTAWYQAPADPRQTGWTGRVIESGIETVTHSVAIADIDLDGDLDVVTAEMHASQDPDEVRVYLNRGGAGVLWTKQVVATSGSHNLRVADVGNDGDYDLFGSNFAGTRVDLWESRLDPHDEVPEPLAALTILVALLAIASLRALRRVRPRTSAGIPGGSG